MRVREAALDLARAARIGSAKADPPCHEAGCRCRFPRASARGTRGCRAPVDRQRWTSGPLSRWTRWSARNCSEPSAHFDQHKNALPLSRLLVLTRPIRPWSLVCPSRPFSK